MKLCKWIKGTLAKEIEPEYDTPKVTIEDFINPFSEEALALGKQFDDAIIAKDSEALEQLIANAKANADKFDSPSQAQIFYCIGNALAENKDAEREQLLEEQIYYFRKSITLIESDDTLGDESNPYVIGFLCCLYTNYANALNQAGRKIAAIEQHKKTLSIAPDFGMALGNLGTAYQHYGKLVPNPNHQHCLQHYAYSLLKQTIDSLDPNIYEDAKNHFKRCLAEYSDEYVEKFLTAPYSFAQYDYETQAELEYRTWVLQNGLFLNPLNDLPYVEFAFAVDSLQLPGITIREGYDPLKPVFHGIFNQLKQEYIYSRYQYYCGIQMCDEVHFADKETCLTNTLDYEQHSIRLEQLKSAFKTAYSILDKIAFFINAYFELEIREDRISFRTLWKSQVLSSKGNYALDSLRWIYKDFHESIAHSPSPKARRIYELRNALEHRHIKVFWELIAEDIPEGLSKHTSETELEKETLQLLKTIREALICLAISVSIEEHNRREGKVEKMTLPITLDEYDDNWKR